MGYLDRKHRSVNMRLHLGSALAFAALLCGAMSGSSARAANEPVGYPALVTLFQQWREFEHPAMKNNVPDYSASAMAAKAAALPRWVKRLDAIDPKSWPIEQQNDYKLMKAEMNGLDFNLRVLRPWARDPAFYVNVWSSRSDVPSREGPGSLPRDPTLQLSFSAQRRGAEGSNREDRHDSCFPRRGKRESQGEQRPRSVGVWRGGTAQSVACSGFARGRDTHRPKRWPNISMPI
jgi:hypothetical protein